MDTLQTLITQAAQRHSVAPDALDGIRIRAETLFPSADPPAPALLDRWLSYLREQEPFWFGPPPEPAFHRDYSALPVRERLNQWRVDHPQPAKHPPLILSPEQVKALGGLSPTQKLARVRELAAAKGRK